MPSQINRMYMLLFYGGLTFIIRFRPRLQWLSLMVNRPGPGSTSTHPESLPGLPC
jgi:hypothetical protein